MPIDCADSIDGRKGWQWAKSVAAYLEWRSGATWRPARERFHPERITHLHSINLLNQAQASLADCACCYCRGAPFADSRRLMHKKAA